MEQNTNIKQIFTKWVVLGALGLASFYFLLSSILSGGFNHAFDQFVSLQPWISLLILSFGIQIGLFQLVRKGSGLIGGSSTVSGASMLICCVHHVSDFVPILGVSALGVILTAYQKDFLILGILMNIGGIYYMARLLHFTGKPLIKYSLIVSLVLIAAFGINAKVAVLEPQTKQVGVVEVEVAPKQLNHGQEMIFTLSLNNHSIDLSYDYTKIAVVVDDSGKIYYPVNWTGGNSGHHVSGDLIFDKMSNNATHVGLNIKGVDGKNVNFDWES